MKTRGRLTGIQVPFRGTRPVISFEVTADPEDVEQFIDIDLDISFSKHRNRRSLDANACLWACIHDIAAALGSDNWTVYLYMLERYGKYTYILVKPDALEAIRRVWRETKVVGECGGMLQVLCFFGSSTYDSKEFSILLDGVISEMKAMRLPTPPSEEMRAALAEMERRERRDKAT